MKIIIQNEEKKKTNWPLKLLNSPFFISFLGALFLAWLANSWDARDATLAIQTETLVLFADEFSKALNLLPESKARALYIRENRVRSAQEREQFSDKRSFDETVVAYEEIENQLRELRDPYSLTAQVRAAFDDDEIRNATNRLDDFFDDMDTTPSLESFLNTHEAAYQEYRLLVEKMGEVLRE